MNEQPEPGYGVAKFVGILLAVVFVGSMIWSVIFETLLPLWRTEQILEMRLNIFGIPIIFSGAGVFVYGGLLFLRGTLQVIWSDEMAAEIEKISAAPRDSNAARWQTLRLLFQAWKRGLLWLVGGFGLIIAGSILINAIKIFGL